MNYNKIQSFFILDTDFNILLNDSVVGEYDSTYDDFVTDLLKSLYELGAEEFKHKLHHISFADSNIDLLWFKEHIVMLISTRDKNRNKQLLYYNQFLEDLSLGIFPLNDIDQVAEYLFSKISEYNEIGLKNKAISIPDTVNLHITMSYVCEESAIPISYLQLDTRSRGPMLVGPMLSAIASFSDSLLKKSIEAIHIGKTRIFFRWTKNRLYTLITRDRNINQYYDSNKMRKIDNILTVMSNSIDLVIIPGEPVDTDKLNTLMSKFIREELKSVDDDHFEGLIV